MKIIFALCLCCIAFCSCDRSIESAPPSDSIDSCRHDLPITTFDSASGVWRQAFWNTHFLSYSRDKKYFATTFSDVTMRPNHGVAVYDVASNTPKFFIPFHITPMWSPDGKQLVVFPSSSGIPTIVNLETLVQSKFTNMIYLSEVSWDDRGEFVYLSRQSSEDNKPFPYNRWGTFRAKRDGSSLEFLTDSIIDAKVLDTETLISFFPRGGYYGFNILHYHIPTRTVTKDTVYGYEGNTIDVYNVELSPDRTKLVFDRLPYLAQATEERSPYGGVWILDINTKQSRQVLPQQISKNLYYPRWYSNTELLCSFHCRKDTAITTWLVDLNGKVLRQITNKNMKLIP